MFCHLAWTLLSACKILQNLVKTYLQNVTVWTKSNAICRSHSDIEVCILNSQIMSLYNQHLFDSCVIQNYFWDMEVKQESSKLRVWLQAFICQRVFSFWIEIWMDMVLKHTHTNTCTVIHPLFKCFTGCIIKLEAHTLWT